MSFFNPSKYIADFLRALFPTAQIYDNIDPTREYTGALMIEIGESDEPETTTFINADFITTRRLYATIRAASVEEATNARAIIRPVIAQILDEADELSAWHFEGEGTSPDIRGIVSGESFYSFIELTIIERGNSGN